MYQVEGLGVVCGVIFVTVVFLQLCREVFRILNKYLSGYV